MSRHLVDRILEDVDSLYDHFLDLNLVLDTNAPVRTASGTGTTDISWGGASGLAYALGDFTYLKTYRQLIEARDYNFLFVDGGAIQIGYSVTPEKITSHRLAYWPCPISIDLDNSQSGILDWLSEICLDAEMVEEAVRMVTPIRFDYAPKQARELHPAAHFTINRSTCRAPVCEALSLRHFVDFILQHFYPDKFDRFRDIAMLRSSSYPCDPTDPSAFSMFFQTVDNSAWK